MRFATIALVLAGVLASAGTAQAHAASATLVFASDRADGVRELYSVRRDGSGQRRLTFNDIVERQPVWSPDGRRIAFAGLKDDNWDIYTVDETGGDLRRLTNNPARDDFPKWTADGRLVFQRGPLICPCEAWVMGADGTHERRLETGHGNALTPEPAPDGHRLAFASDRDGAWALYTMHLGGGKARRITDASGLGFGDFNPRWSPRRKEIAFLRDTDGTDNDLYVVHADGTNLRRLTATPERVEFWPAWAPDGSEIVFTAGFGPQRLHAISLDDGHEEAVSTSPSAPFVETFEDGVRDASLWHEIADPGASIGEEGGRLVASIAGTAIPGGPFNQVATHWGLQCTAAGEFDAQVDFELVTWPTPGGLFAGLSAIFADAGIWRYSAPWGDNISSWIAPDGLGVPLTPMSASFRIVREGGTTSTYVRAGSSGWTLVQSGAASAGAAVLAPSLSAPAAEFQHLDGRAAFDNFRLNSGELTCPDWWNNFAGDVR